MSKQLEHLHGVKKLKPRSLANSKELMGCLLTLVERLKHFRSLEGHVRLTWPVEPMRLLCESFVVEHSQNTLDRRHRLLENQVEVVGRPGRSHVFFLVENLQVKLSWWISSTCLGITWHKSLAAGAATRMLWVLMPRSGGCLVCHAFSKRLLQRCTCHKLVSRMFMFCFLLSLSSAVKIRYASSARQLPSLSNPGAPWLNLLDWSWLMFPGR